MTFEDSALHMNQVEHFLSVHRGDAAVTVSSIEASFSTTSSYKKCEH